MKPLLQYIVENYTKSQIIDIINNMEDNDPALERIGRSVEVFNPENQKKFKDWITNKWYGENAELTKDDMSIIKILVKYISHNNENMELFRKLINNDNTIKLPELNTNNINTGDLYSILKNSDLKLSNDFIKVIYDMTHSGTINVGKSELLLQTFFSNIKRPRKSGDDGGEGDARLIINNRSEKLEIKGNDGRFTPSGLNNNIKNSREYAVKKLINIELNDELLKLVDNIKSNNKFSNMSNDDIIKELLLEGNFLVSKRSKSKMNNEICGFNHIKILMNLSDINFTTYWTNLLEQLYNYKIDEGILNEIKNNKKYEDKIKLFRSLMASVNLLKYSENDEFNYIIFINEPAESKDLKSSDNTVDIEHFIDPKGSAKYIFLNITHYKNKLSKLIDLFYNNFTITNLSNTDDRSKLAANITYNFK